jgi:uncharacterized membrane protein YcaP (DUF421 family)
LASVGLVVLEPNGSISVIRAAHRDEWIEGDLAGAGAPPAPSVPELGEG